MFKLTILSKIHTTCHLDANRIKPGSNSKMADKHAAENSKSACMGVNKSMNDVYSAHTTIWPEVSVSLTKLHFLHVNCHTSKSFLD